MHLKMKFKKLDTANYKKEGSREKTCLQLERETQERKQTGALRREIHREMKKRRRSRGGGGFGKQYETKQRLGCLLPFSRFYYFFIFGFYF